MASTNKCLAQSNKSPHRANATKKRKIKPTTKDQNMTRLLICAATLLALTATTPASAQSAGPWSSGYFGTRSDFPLSYPPPP
jgi:hypothetical protein